MSIESLENLRGHMLRLRELEQPLDSVGMLDPREDFERVRAQRVV